MGRNSKTGSVAEPEAVALDGVIAQRYDPAAPIDSVQPHPQNVNEGDLGAVIESMKATGFHGALLIQESTGYIVAGSHRWRAAKEMGLAHLPMIFGEMSDETALRKMLADNRTARLGHDDPAGLAALLESMHAEYGTLDGTGFDGDALDEMLADLAAAAPAPTRYGSAGKEPEKGSGQQLSGLEYRVVVDCSCEAHQTELLDRFHWY